MRLPTLLVNDIKHYPGVISMARTDDPNSASSQFFIVHQTSPHLDGKYAAFGHVISGMEFVDNIKKGGGFNGTVYDPDIIVSMEVIADM